MGWGGDNTNLASCSVTGSSLALIRYVSRSSLALTYMLRCWIFTCLLLSRGGVGWGGGHTKPASCSAIGFSFALIRYATRSIMCWLASLVASSIEVVPETALNARQLLLEVEHHRNTEACAMSPTESGLGWCTS